MNETDISDQIHADNKMFPIPIRITHKVLYTEQSNECHLVCRICGTKLSIMTFGIRRDMNGALTPVPMLNKATNDINSHRKMHRFEKLNLDLESTRDGFCADWNSLYIILNSVCSKLMDISRILTEVPQLMMITVSTQQPDIYKFNKSMVKEFGARRYSIDGYGYGFYAINDPYHDFKAAYIRHMIEWDFVCIFCGNEYETGLPSIEIVNEHLIECVRRIELNKMEYNLHYAFTPDNWLQNSM